MRPITPSMPLSFFPVPHFGRVISVDVVDAYDRPYPFEKMHQEDPIVLLRVIQSIQDLLDLSPKLSGLSAISSNVAKNFCIFDENKIVYLDGSDYEEAASFYSEETSKINEKDTKNFQKNLNTLWDRVKVLFFSKQPTHIATVKVIIADDFLEVISLRKTSLGDIPTSSSN